MASLRGAGTRRYTRRRRGSSRPAVASSSTETLRSARRAPLASLGRATLLCTQSRVQHAHPRRHWAPRHPGTGYAWLPVVWQCALLWHTACTRPPCQATSRGARSRSRAAAAAATCAPCSSAAARASTTSTRTSPPLRSAAARQMPLSRPPTRARAHSYSAVRALVPSAHGRGVAGAREARAHRAARRARGARARAQRHARPCEMWRARL